MFSRMRTRGYTKDFSENMNKLRYELRTAEAVVIGIGAGMSAASGFDYSGERFEKAFGDFHQKYGITDMYSGGFFPFPIRCSGRQVKC